MKRPRENFHPDRWNGKKSSQRTEFSAADRIGIFHAINAGVLQQWADAVGVDLDSMELVLKATTTEMLRDDITNNTINCLLTA
jgi:hypothetical protein